jgi:outer membrane protein assembly factor BamD (BamD/ComL family)
MKTSVRNGGVIKVMKKILIPMIFFILLAGSICAWIFSNVAKKENIAGAQACYEQGETVFAQKNFKEAMRRYEMVDEFYGKPHTKWLAWHRKKNGFVEPT